MRQQKLSPYLPPMNILPLDDYGIPLLMSKTVTMTDPTDDENDPTDPNR